MTGAAGFVGSHVATLLLARGDEVVGLDNFDPYYAPSRKWEHVEEVRAGPGGSRFSLVEGDIRDRDLLDRLFRQGFTGVAHLAGLGGVRASVERPHEYVEVNTVGTLNVLEAVRQAKVPNLVFVSTSSAYGNAKPPFAETDAADRPLAPYAASKRSAELLAHAYHHAHGISCSVVRLFTAYGPRNRPDMMAYKVLESIFSGREIPLFGNGHMVRDWTYVEDVAGGIVAALDKPLGYEIMNLGRGQPISLREFIETIEKTVGRKANLVSSPRLESDAVATEADISKARRLLGYEPRVSVREGVERLCRWYVERAEREDAAARQKRRRLGIAHGE
ncbi:MAG TPA: NAD-dependent epimerase/dehydratase family protein [Anaeromyxobacteraceae bacterium]|nr:NAD-dependent epimerase/dehydratase family protein [Anaeromyxobacteraceae bacterium]